MESSLYKQFKEYDNMYIRKVLVMSDDRIKKIFKKAWGKDGIECNLLNYKDEKILNQAIDQFEINLANYEDEISKKILEKLPKNFFDYFDKDDLQLVLEIIEESKTKYYIYYNLLTKIYGEQYSLINKKVLITKKDFSIFENYVVYIQEQIQIKKRNLKLRTKIKNNFLEYFEEDDKSLVITILNEYKLEKKQYFPTLIKLYGENYDKLNEILLVEKDVSAIEKLIVQISKKLEKMKIDNKIRNEIKENFLDYFNDYNIILVKKTIDSYKNVNTFYYNTIVKLYGNEYNKLNKEIALTEKDFYIVTTTVIQITKRLISINNRVVENNNYMKKKTAETEFNIKSLTEYFKTTEDVIDEAISQLPSIERKCIKFYYGIGMRNFSINEIAKILNISEEEVKENIEKAVIMMGNSIRIIKGRENREANTVKIKVRPKAYKKQ